MAPEIKGDMELDTVTDVIKHVTNKSGGSIALLSLALDDSAGVSREVEEQARELTENGFDVTIFVLEGENDTPNCADVEVLGSPDNVYIQKLTQLFYPVRLPKIIRLVRQLSSFDAVVAHRYPLTVPAYIASQWYSVPYIVWHYHVPEPESMGTFSRRMFMHILGYLEERSILIRNADVVCSITESSRQMLLDSVGIDSLVITNDTVTNRFSGVTPDLESMGEKYGISTDNPVILFVGRLTDTKNILELIKTFKSVREQIPSAKLVIVGKPRTPNYFEQLKNAAEENTILTGFVSDEELLALYKMCDVYATCSMREGRNLPAGEAQSYGAKVIGFDVPGNEDTIKQGSLVEPGNYDAFAEEVIKTLQC